MSDSPFEAFVLRKSAGAREIEWATLAVLALVGVLAVVLIRLLWSA